MADAFLIQHTQNRDTRALHLKIDELLKATRGARNSMIDLDHLSDQKVMQLEAEFKRICSSNVESATDADPDRLAPESALIGGVYDVQRRHNRRYPHPAQPYSQ